VGILFLAPRTWRRILKTIAKCEAIEFPQKTLLRSCEHPLQAAVWQKGATAFVPKTFKEPLTVKRSDDVANSYILGIVRQPNAAVSAADSRYVAGCSKRLCQHTSICEKWFL
jgi:hypothetical protein